MEEWRDIEGFEGLYQVSNQGNVKRFIFGKERLLKTNPNKNNRCLITLRKNNKGKCCEVGRLVAKAFVPNPNNYQLITYIDYNSTNNKADNLKWVSSREELIKTIPFRFKEIIDYKGERFRTYKDLALHYGINPASFRIRRYYGWSLEDALSIPVDKKHRKLPFVYDYYGEKLTIKQISERTGISRERIQKRLNHKWSLYEAAEIPVSITNKKKERK